MSWNHGTLYNSFPDFESHFLAPVFPMFYCFPVEPKKPVVNLDLTFQFNQKPRKKWFPHVRKACAILYWQLQSKKSLALELGACSNQVVHFCRLRLQHSFFCPQYVGHCWQAQRTTKSHNRMAPGFLASSYRPKLASEFVTTQANLQNQECSTEESNCSHCLKALVQVNNEVHTPYLEADLT